MIVPADVAVRIHANVEVGEIELPNGIGGDGRNVESELVETGDRVLVLDASVGAGRSWSSAPYDDRACRCGHTRRAPTSG